MDQQQIKNIRTRYPWYKTANKGVGPPIISVIYGLYRIINSIANNQT